MMMDMRPRAGRRIATAVVLALAISACANSGDSARQRLEEDLRESVEAVLDEGWSQTPSVAGLCEYGDAETPSDRCLAYAAYLDAEGCPIGAFSFGFLYLVADFPDPLHATAEEEWTEISTRYDCSIDLADFNSQPGSLEGPTEASALEFVSDFANQPAFDERWGGLFSEPRVALETRIDGDCAAVRFLEQGGDSEMEPWTVFLRWEEGEWHPQSVTLIPDAIMSLNESVDGCYG
jgi:hypothetical protein